MLIYDTSLHICKITYIAISYHITKMWIYNLRDQDDTTNKHKKKVTHGLHPYPFPLFFYSRIPFFFITKLPTFFLSSSLKANPCAFFLLGFYSQELAWKEHGSSSAWPCDGVLCWCSWVVLGVQVRAGGCIWLVLWIEGWSAGPWL